MAYRRRSSFFGGPRRRVREAVTRSTLTARKRGRCKYCKAWFNAGDQIVKLRLKKPFRAPCTGCGAKPTGSKQFHPNCVPQDINKAMGYDPTLHAHQASPHVHSVAPPPKPPSPAEAGLAALASLEQFLVLRLRNDPKAWVIKDGKRVLTPEWEKSFSRLQGIKSRVLRPGTPEEGDVATSIALQQLVKMAFAN